MIQTKVKIILRTGLVGLAATVLAGCMPHLSKQQCETMNWYQVGQQDGSQGKFPRSLQRDITDCAQFKLTVNATAYHRGWRAGTRSFCRPQNGFRMGAQGLNYNHVCPSNMSAAFNQAWRRGLRRYCIPSTGYNLGRAGQPMPNFCGPNQVTAFSNAYNQGYRIFSTENAINNEMGQVRNQISSTQNAISNNRKNIQHWQNRLDRDFPHLHHKARKRERRRMHQNIRNARANIRDLEFRLNRLNHRLNRLQGQYNREASM